MLQPVIAAWKRWDMQPGGIESTNRLEDACKTLAEQLGVTTTTFREVVAHHRRNGKTVEEAVEYAVAKLETAKNLMRA